MPHPPNYLTGSPIKKIDMDNKEDFAIDEINREQDRWNYIEEQLEAAEKKVKELEKELEEIRDLARTGLPPQSFGMTSLEEWKHYKINRIAGMADEALNKDQEV